MEAFTRFFRLMALVLLAAAASAADAARTTRYSIIEITIPQATWIEATGINNRGDVVGWFRAPFPGLSFEPERSFLWQNGTARDIGVPAGTNNSRINAINDSGVACGYYASTTAPRSRSAIVPHWSRNVGWPSTIACEMPVRAVTPGLMRRRGSSNCWYSFSLGF